MSWYKIIFGLASLGCITGTVYYYAIAPKLDVKTVEYYFEHPDEAKEVVQSCKKISKNDENCTNAKEAYGRMMMNPNNDGYPDLYKAFQEKGQTFKK
jgi:hypothetical protein